MHKTYKDALNEDGFTTKKDKYTGWKIVYWHTITNTSHINDEKTGKPFWRVDMDAKLERWMRVLETVELDNPYERRTKTMTSPDTLANLPPPPTTSSKSDSDLDLDLDLDESERPKLPKRRPAAKHKAPQKQKPRPVDVSSLLAAAIEDGDEY